MPGVSGWDRVKSTQFGAGAISNIQQHTQTGWSKPSCSSPLIGVIKGNPDRTTQVNVCDDSLDR